LGEIYFIHEAYTLQRNIILSDKYSVLVVMLLISSSLHADSLPGVTGLASTGNQLTWDAQNGATGYNNNLDYQYFDTVREKLDYTLTEPGRYHDITLHRLMIKVSLV
jgi:hypothetical protein